MTSISIDRDEFDYIYKDRIFQFSILIMNMYKYTWIFFYKWNSDSSCFGIDNQNTF